MKEKPGRRFKSAGNDKTHGLGIVDASTGEWIVGGPSTKPLAVSVDMAACQSDVLGFCYTEALSHSIELMSGSKYYIVSSEVAGETFINMTKSVTGADYGTCKLTSNPPLLVSYGTVF